MLNFYYFSKLLAALQILISAPKTLPGSTPVPQSGVTLQDEPVTRKVLSFKEAYSLAQQLESHYKRNHAWLTPEWLWRYLLNHLSVIPAGISQILMETAIILDQHISYPQFSTGRDTTVLRICIFLCILCIILLKWTPKNQFLRTKGFKRHIWENFPLHICNSYAYYSSAHRLRKNAARVPHEYKNSPAIRNNLRSRGAEQQSPYR